MLTFLKQKTIAEPNDVIKKVKVAAKKAYIITFKFINQSINSPTLCYEIIKNLWIVAKMLVGGLVMWYIFDMPI